MSSEAELKKKTTTLDDTSIAERLERIEKLIQEILWIVKQSLPKPKGD